MIGTKNNHWRSRGVLLALAGYALVVVLGVYFGNALILPGFTVVSLIGLAFWFSWNGLPLVGPLLRFELVRASRQGRLFLFRCAYAAGLLAVLYLLYCQWFPAQMEFFWSSNTSLLIPMSEQARFAESFFYWYSLAQLGAVFLFTPAYLAGVIAEEKERRTLEYLLISDLTDREIVLTKLAARLCHLVLLLATGLPVLTLLMFMGGIDPELLVAAFFSNFFTMLSLAGISVLCSVYAERTLTALLGAYVLSATLLFCNGSCLLNVVGKQSLNGPLHLVFSGNPVLGALASGFLNCWIAGMLCRWAILRMRTWHRLQASQPVGPPPELHIPPVMGRQYVQPLGDDALKWKERRGGATPGFFATTHRFWKEVAVPVLTMTAVIIPCIMLVQFYLQNNPVGNPVGTFANATVRIAGTGVLSAMIVATALRTAFSLSLERERCTLDMLLTLPVENRDFLLARLRSSLWHVRRGWYLLVPLWLAATVVGGVQWWAMPAMMLAGGICLLFAANLGLFLGLICRSALRAVLWTLFVFFLLTAVPPFVAYSPPALMASLTTWGLPSSELTSTVPDGPMPLALALGVYGFAAWVLWRLTTVRFGPVTGRMPYGRPRPQELSP